MQSSKLSPWFLAHRQAQIHAPTAHVQQSQDTQPALAFALKACANVFCSHSSVYSPKINTQLPTLSRLPQPIIRLAPLTGSIPNSFLLGSRRVSFSSPLFHIPRPQSSKLSMSATASSQMQSERKQPVIKYRKDYVPPSFLIYNVDLAFLLKPHDTLVYTKISASRNSLSKVTDQDWILDGADTLNLLELKIDGVLATEGQEYSKGKNENGEPILIIKKDYLRKAIAENQNVFLETVVKIDPMKNKAFSGLYLSGGTFCTQCEAEGFRRITYFADRPDVMSKYTTTVMAPQSNYPILLGNGNCIESGNLSPDAIINRSWASLFHHQNDENVLERSDWHYVVYEDPWPKPCYLFAIVAGNLVARSGTYITRPSKRTVNLNVFVEQKDKHKCDHALASLINAMKWDEKFYGREYDLEVFNIVAVDSFNMGAMENKSLNIFNSKYVLASPDTATDSDYNAIEGVVGHEYFHNYSGNRVTCRDWFQLSLKEGFTVFRDQEFSADMSGEPAVKRIMEVGRLRNAQFPEDAGPTAHPIRPDSFIEINNFYTVTIYEKGAEVIRMMYNIIGQEGFRKGTDLYFDRHDGQAVTCDDFVQAVQDANPHVSLDQFKLWYSQAGTPELLVSISQSSDQQQLHLQIDQHIPDTPGQTNKLPMHIPFSVGLIGPDGEPIPVDIGDGDVCETKVLNLRKKSESFTFKNCSPGTVISMLRGFSAPVKLFRRDKPGLQEYITLMAHDTDEFCRYEASQALTLNTLLDYVVMKETGHTLSEIPEALVEAFRSILKDDSLGPALRALIFSFPSEAYISDQLKTFNPDVIHEVRVHFVKELAIRLKNDLVMAISSLRDLTSGEYTLDSVSKGRRSLKNTLLDLVAVLEDPQITKQCLIQLREANNMTDSLAALSILSKLNSEDREIALSEFYKRWESEYLVVDKWLRIQATVGHVKALSRVQALVEHKAFDITNPNNCYAVLGGFGIGNPYGFHASKGESYKFYADQVLKIDSNNPQVAARLMGAFTKWKRLDDERQGLMKGQLERIASFPGISKDVFEIAKKCLA